MWWVAWCVPFMVAGLAVAVVPVLWGSLRLRDPEEISVRSALCASEGACVGEEPAATDGDEMLAVSCPLCEFNVLAKSSDALVDRVGRHAWLVHGIPSAKHVLESAVAS